MSDTPRYEVQRIAGRQSALHDEVVNFRVTDKATDSRIATCYLEENADLIVAALNSLAAMTKRAEELDAELQDVRSLAFNLLEPRTEEDARDDTCEQVQLLHDRLTKALEYLGTALTNALKRAEEAQRQASIWEAESTAMRHAHALATKRAEESEQTMRRMSDNFENELDAIALDETKEKL